MSEDVRPLAAAAEAAELAGAYSREDFYTLIAACLRELRRREGRLHGERRERVDAVRAAWVQAGAAASLTRAELLLLLQCFVSALRDQEA